MERRDVLRTLTATAGIGVARRLLPPELVRVGRDVHSRIGAAPAPAVLTAHAAATVAAAAERIIPASETPGATVAGVHLFADRMLADWFTTAERDRFLGGLRALDALSRSRHARDFVACSAAEQEALLTTFDDEVATLRSAPPGDPRLPPTGNPDDHWFAMLKFLTVWGYCTSEVGMRELLHAYPLPGRYEACAPYDPGSPTHSPS